VLECYGSWQTLFFAFVGQVREVSVDAERNGGRVQGGQIETADELFQKGI